MTNVGRARVTLSPGDVAIAGAASGVFTRAICQVTLLWRHRLLCFIFTASGRVQDPNATPVRSEGWEIQGTRSPCNHLTKVSRAPILLDWQLEIWPISLRLSDTRPGQ